MCQLTRIPTPKACTCSNCPQFDDYGDSIGRGWCKLFDKSSRSHHTLTQDCLTALDSGTEDEAEEDFDHCKYQPGDTVKLIDANEHHTEWQSCTVVGQKYNHQRFKSIESYLTQPNWYIYIIDTQHPIPVPFWVSQKEICLSEQSEFMATTEVF